MKKFLSTFFAVVLLNACATKNEPVPQKFEEPRFMDNQKIELKVNKIIIESEFVPTFTRPNVEHLFPISLEKTAKLWAEDRLEAVDFASNKQATFLIKDASVTEELIVSDDVFKKNSIKYRAKLSVVLKISDKHDFSSAETSLEAWRELTIPEDTSIEDKEMYWKRMVDKLFEEFNKKMQINTYKYLNMYVDSSQYIHNMESSEEEVTEVEMSETIADSAQTITTTETTKTTRTTVEVE